MQPQLRASVACAFIACVSGCASSGAPLTTVSVLNARNTITIGKSTKSDVIAALGKTTVISFDSGYEVWVYEVTGGTPAKRALDRTEFVVLFAPSGVVAKTRIRPPPLPQGT